jgi:hypothetical protein
MLVGASIFAYVVSAIVSVVASFGEERRQCVQHNPPCFALLCTTATPPPPVASAQPASRFGARLPAWHSDPYPLLEYRHPLSRCRQKRHPHHPDPHRPPYTHYPPRGLLRFNTSMDILNEYLDEYKFPSDIKKQLRMYFHHCRYVTTAAGLGCHGDLAAPSVCDFCGCAFRLVPPGPCVGRSSSRA